MKSLLVRLVAAFAVVILIAVAIIFVIVNQTTTTEFQSYMFRGGMTQTDEITRQLAAYYSARGSWQGVERYLALGADGMMGGNPRGRAGQLPLNVSFDLADANGVVVFARDSLLIGKKMTAAQSANGVAIQVGGQMVGTLIEPPGASGFDAQQQDYLLRVNLSLLLAGVVAGGIALVLGALLFSQITAPLNALASASRKIAAGDLTARIASPRDDEVGQVGRAFNAMADSLAQSETARRNMIADIAHELRNPLGIVQGQLEGMIDGVFPMSSEQIASMYDETILLTRLVDDLRDLALADAGQLQITRTRADLGALIEKTVGAFAAQATEKNITLNTTLADVPWVKMDAQRIAQVLRNLISNALRHTLDGGAVTVDCAFGASADQVIVRVRDTGTGIAADEMPHVFERFWRGDKSRSRVGGGAGLGLAIAKQLIAAHGGVIGVESQAGQGALFWFTLPVGS